VRPDRSELIAHHGFPLDGFQVQALDVLDSGQSVLVAAPTGSGKTVVAEYAIAAALADGRRAFYTAPIKALSNQKFRDLGGIHGADRVGLLTGDNSIHGDAPAVVMTTEVLRNMIYGRASALDRLEYVVLDEVHFIQDTYRGPVWEEVIIHLPTHVRLVCLSATVSNADEVADWISTVRGPTKAIIEETRPVRLDNLYMVGDRTSDRMHLMPTLLDGRPNHEAARLDDEGGRGRPRHRGHRGYPQPRRRLYTPARLDVIERLAEEDLLPAIYFIFSRNACDEAARGVLSAGVRLTTSDERTRIREIIDARLGDMDPSDLDVLGFPAFQAQLEAGVAAHHAGMVPTFKETVEACFVEGLVKAVFATETLAVGVNMPARSVVIEKLSKFTGEHHEFLTPGQYTQLTGRAGRRGIDDLGHAIVLWSPFVPFDQVAGLAGSRAFRLTSAFRPTYNMAANLVRSCSSEEAHHLLNLSFAQYQADRDVVRMEARLERRQAHLSDLRRAADSPYGDIEEYRALSHASSGVRSESTVEARLARLRPGDVIHVSKGRVSGRAAVIATAYRKGGVKVSVMTTRRATLNLSAPDFALPPEVLGTVEIPHPYQPHKPEFQKLVVQRLDKMRVKRVAAATTHDDALDAHPVEDDPDLARRLKAASQAERIATEIDDLRRGVKGRSQSIARRFDRVLGILDDWGYVDGWSLTPAGEMLSRTFHECDLLVAEATRRGLLDGLDPDTLAGLASCFVYEHRSPEPPPAPWFPSPAVRDRWRAIAGISADLQVLEVEAGLPTHRSPDPTFLAIAYAWSSGETFAEVVGEEELTGGDFVRTTKQLIDLLRQLAIVAPERDTRRSAEIAADRLFRGVVAASSQVTEDPL
jgi:ATP-dependent RNA helicase HelY